MKQSIWLQPNAIACYALSLLALAEMVDMTIVAIAIPQLMSALNTNFDSIAMISTSYIIVAAILTPLTGIAIRKYSTRSLALVASALFCIASVLCGTAETLPEMIFFRILQGAGGAFLPSTAQAYIERTFHGTPLEKPMLTVFAGIVVLGPIIGTILGGILTARLSWRFIFFVNVPICVAGFLLILIFMKGTPAEKVDFDFKSFGLMAIGVGALEFFVDQGNHYGWFQSMHLLIVFTISMVALFFFIWRGLLGSSVINFNLFRWRNKNFIFNTAAVFIISVFVAVSMSYFPAMLQQIYNYPVDTTGFLTTPRGVIVLLSAPIVALLSNILGTRETMLIGMLTFAWSCFMMSHFSPYPNAEEIIFSTVVQGFSLMAIFIPVLQLCTVGLAENEREEASGIFNFFRTFGTSIGTSVAATLVSHQFNVSYHDLIAHISPYATGYTWWVQNLVGAPEALQLAVAQAQVMLQSALISYLDSFYCAGVYLLWIAWLPFILQKPPEEKSILKDYIKAFCLAGYHRIVSFKT